MGSVRKLATVVVIALIAVATAVTVYTANEPNRRESETTEQQNTQIERGTSLYITYCLQCHGPAGLGAAEKGPDGTGSMGRTGGILNQAALYPADELATMQIVFQSDDPVRQGIAEDWIRFRIMYGLPSEPQVKQDGSVQVQMPAFRHDLNVEQINDLVFLIMHGDWNYVYNTAIHQTGLQVCEQTPEAERTGMCEGDMHDAAAYPTAPPKADAEVDADATPTEAPAADGTDHAIEAVDTAFDTNAITVKPGDTITLTNSGFLQHDLYIDGLGIETNLLNGGETQTITIPADAAPGDYDFWCTVTGHKESGMQGIITVVAP
ncbi:MAG: cupredoxin domain-containing protein [Thermomicrobiales bacterium]|nr:cupredoxin domain-containing protein [Thermomicrobiales bacterium]